MVLNEHQKIVIGCFGWRYRKGLEYVFRHDVIPYTGKRGGYRFYKHPKTLNEMKQNSGVDEKYVRGKRRVQHIPNAWDDIHRCVPKCWKSQRKTQYKIVDIK